MEDWCNKVVHIPKSEILFLFAKGIYYRGRDPTRLSKEVLTHCLSQARNLDPVTESLVAIGLEQTYPGSVTLEFIRERIRFYIRKDPHSHGIHRMIGLHAFITRDNTDEEQKLIDVVAKSILDERLDTYDMKTTLLHFEFRMNNQESICRVRNTFALAVTRKAVELYDYAEDLKEKPSDT